LTNEVSAGLGIRQPGPNVPSTFTEGDYNSFSIYDTFIPRLLDGAPYQGSSASMHLIPAGTTGKFWFIDYSQQGVAIYDTLTKTLTQLADGNGGYLHLPEYNTEPGFYAQISRWQSIFGKYTVLEEFNVHVKNSAPYNNSGSGISQLEVYKDGLLLQIFDDTDLMTQENLLQSQNADISPDGQFIVVSANDATTTLDLRRDVLRGQTAPTPTGVGYIDFRVNMSNPADNPTNNSRNPWVFLDAPPGAYTTGDSSYANTAQSIYGGSLPYLGSRNSWTADLKFKLATGAYSLYFAMASGTPIVGTYGGTVADQDTVTHSAGTPLAFSGVDNTHAFKWQITVGSSGLWSMQSVGLVPNTG
jgi:hypothetical protein